MNDERKLVVNDHLVSSCFYNEQYIECILYMVIAWQKRSVRVLLIILRLVISKSQICCFKSWA